MVPSFANITKNPYLQNICQFFESKFLWQKVPFLKYQSEFENTIKCGLFNKKAHKH